MSNERPQPEKPTACAVGYLDTCPPEELEPVARALEGDLRVSEPVAFPRGTLLPDGRLDLCKQRIGPQGAARIADALRGNTFVSALLLGADGLMDDGATAIAERVAASPSIETLFMGCNQIGPDGVKGVVDALGPGSHLRALWIKRNPIGDAGVEALCRWLDGNEKLRTLDLVQCGLRARHVEPLVDALVRSGVQRVYLGGNRLGPSAGRMLRPLLTKLNALYLSAAHLGDDGLRGLLAGVEAVSLRVLALGSNGISDSGLRSLIELARRNPQLANIELYDTPSAWVVDAPSNTLGDQAATLQVLLADREPAQTDDRDDVRAIRSVYRVSAKGSAETAKSSPAPDPSGERDEEALELPEIDAQEVERAVALLQTLREYPQLFEQDKDALQPLRAEVNRVVAAIQKNRRRDKKKRARADSRRDRAAARRDVRKRRSRDRVRIAQTGLRKSRNDGLPPPDQGAPTGPPHSPPPAIGGGDDRLETGRHCYICKADYARLDAFYDALCPACAAFSHEKRAQSADLDGRTAVVTGGRIKIGLQIALKLLRAGADVVITTRFPVNAELRLRKEPDFEAWSDRVEIHGLDLRHLRGVERFCETLRAERDALDILINNASQTVRRPPAYYEHLMEIERAGQDEVTRLSPHRHHVIGGEAMLAAELAQANVLPGDERFDLDAFPPGQRALDGQQLDRRAVNSWAMRIGEVPTLEAAEVHYVNALGPFALLSGLLPLLRASRAPRRYVVNVSAMEGKFDYPAKQGNHPHTNMAKAASNMLTRTIAADLAVEHIYVNSVDTGWITNEQPLQITERMREQHNFEPPLDEVDGAARVLDPVFATELGADPVFGAFLKDYRKVTW